MKFHGVMSAFVVVAVVACSSSSRTIADSSPGPSTDAGLDGTTRSEAGGGDAGGKTSGPPKLCVPDRCSQQEAQDYADCFTGECNDTLEQCYGADYKSGTYTGVCASYKSCVDACDCDYECKSKCTRSAVCDACLQPATSACSQKCPSPTCYVGEVITEFTCQDLNTCCHKIQDTSQQQGCLAIWSNYGANGSDNDCERVYVRDYASMCK